MASRAIEANEYLAFINFRGAFLRELFPEFYTHPRRNEILKKAGLDDEAIAKLVIPPLPF